MTVSASSNTLTGVINNTLTTTTGDIIYASATNTLSNLADVATGNALISGGVGVAPSYGKIGLTTHVSGTLPIASGGTGQTTASAAFNALSPITSTGDLIIGNGTNSATRLAIGTNGYILTSNGTTASWAAAPATGLTITSTSTNANYYLGTANATSGTATVEYVNSSFTMNPGTGALTAPNVVASNGLLVHSTTVSASYSIPSGSNAIAAGPMTVASGVTVTIPSGSRWLVL